MLVAMGGWKVRASERTGGRARGRVQGQARGQEARSRREKGAGGGTGEKS